MKKSNFLAIMLILCLLLSSLVGCSTIENAGFDRDETTTPVTNEITLPGVNTNPEVTDIYDGITVTKLPYMVKRLIVTNIFFDGTKVTVRVTNNTGNAIDGISSISYKCYDNNGTILGTDNLYLESMNNGETADVYFYAESGTSKILFGDATIYNK